MSVWLTSGQYLIGIVYMLSLGFPLPSPSRCPPATPITVVRRPSPLSLSPPFSSSSSHSSNAVPATSITIAAPLHLRSPLARRPSPSPRHPHSPLLTLPIYHPRNIHRHHHSLLPLRLSLEVTIKVGVESAMGDEKEDFGLAVQNVRDYGFAGSVVVTDESIEEEGFALNLKTFGLFARPQDLGIVTLHLAQPIVEDVVVEVQVEHAPIPAHGEDLPSLGEETTDLKDQVGSLVVALANLNEIVFTIRGELVHH
ncbi:hypothetical protein ACLOJK_018933 [Asimina triloba]